MKARLRAGFFCVWSVFSDASTELLNAPPELNDATAVALGGPAIGQADVLLQCFALFGKMQAGFEAGVRFTIESLGDCGGTARGADRQNLDLEDAALVFDAELVAGVDFAGRLGTQAIRLNAAHVAGARGHGARFEETRRPKPLIDAHGCHLKGGAQFVRAAAGGVCHQELFSAFQM